MKLPVCLLLTVVLVLVSLARLRAAEPIAGVGPSGPVEQVQTDFVFTEGPAADAEGNLYFSDVRANRIYKLAAGGQMAVFLEESQGANGLMFDQRGRLIACQGLAQRVVAIDIGTRQIEVLADAFQGTPLTKPNDLVVDRAGGVYFTDPEPGAVYYVGPDHQVQRVVEGLPRPNGCILSPDEQTLYVLPSGLPALMAYPIVAPGRVGEGRQLCQLEQAAEGEPRGGDGLTVDAQGTLYLTQPSLSALQVVDPDGTVLGLISFPEGPANCTFGGPGLRTLYVTARTSLYRAPMERTGHRFAAGE